jgi:serine/threonine-protein kinase
MEFVEGRSLGQSLSESGPFPVREALRLSRQVAEALGYLHGAGYLHRDVKPDNVLVDGSGNARLCDLGFSVPIPRHAEDGSKAPTAVGTAGYMSPEALAGRPDVKVGADLYSLGVLLYALLTGHEPYTGASSEEVATEQIETGAPVPNLMVVSAAPPVVQFLKRLMHPDLSRRFPSAAEVVAAIDRIPAG